MVSKYYNQETFEQYHSDNPEVYELFIKFTKRAAQKRNHYSAWTIMNIIRWHAEIETNDAEFKVNNNWIAYYARKFMEEHPKYNGFFELRDMKH